MLIRFYGLAIRQTLAMAKPCLPVKSLFMRHILSRRWRFLNNGKDTQLSNAAVNAEADALARLLDNGYLRVYDGTKPATGNTAISGNTLMSEHRFSATSAPAACQRRPDLQRNHRASRHHQAVRPPGSARSQERWGNRVMDGTCGATGSASNLEFASLPLVLGGAVTISSFTHTVPAATTGV